MDMLLELRMVDKVVLTEDVFPFDNIRRHRPDVYVRGREDQRLPEQGLLDELGIETVFIDKDTNSSTGIIERIGL
jgi:bifunctional ADP-heptose synthase (sugar kinase/adenylyltransferase)